MEHTGDPLIDPLALDWPQTFSATEAAAESAVQFAKVQEGWTSRLRLVLEHQAVRVLSRGGHSVRQISRALGMSVGNVYRYGQADPPVPESDAEARWMRETIRTAWKQDIDQKLKASEETRAKPAVAVAPENFLFLTEMAAEGMAHATADMIEHMGKFLQPGDPFGTILCLAWRGDRGWARLAFGAYFRELQRDCDRREIECPSRDRVLRTVEIFSLNPARFPDVDIPALMASLR